MAFTESELNQIVMITRVDRVTLNGVLDYYESYITAEVEADVRDEIERWDTYGGQFVKLNPTESNKGVETDSGDVKGDIRNNIAMLLFLTEYIASSGQIAMVRG